MNKFKKSNPCRIYCESNWGGSSFYLNGNGHLYRICYQNATNRKMGLTDPASTCSKKCENKTVATHANNCFCDLKIT